MKKEPWKDAVRQRISAAWASRCATMADRQRLMRIKKRWVLDGIAPGDADEAFMLALLVNAAAPRATKPDDAAHV